MKLLNLINSFQMIRFDANAHAYLYASLLVSNRTHFNGNGDALLLIAVFCFLWVYFPFNIFHIVKQSGIIKTNIKPNQFIKCLLAAIMGSVKHFSRYLLVWLDCLCERLLYSRFSTHNVQKAFPLF